MTTGDTSELRVAVVTGGAAGIGWGISQRLARDGFQIVIVGRSEAVMTRAAELRAEGLVSYGLQADLSETSLVPQLAARILETSGRCDVLVNNAGTHIKKPDGQRIRFEEMTIREWETSIALHMTAPALLCQAFLPGMKARGWGRIVNISSRAARTTTIQSSVPYAVSKAGCSGLSRAIAGEYASYGITCNTIAPGRFRTALTDLDTAAMKAASLQGIPVGRIGEPDEIGAAAAFLASADAGFITGATLDMNGGAFVAP